jgi:hypothetical protein
VGDHDFVGLNGRKCNLTRNRESRSIPFPSIDDISLNRGEQEVRLTIAREFDHIGVNCFGSDTRARYESGGGALKQPSQFSSDFLFGHAKRISVESKGGRRRSDGSSGLLKPHPYRGADAAAHRREAGY